MSKHSLTETQKLREKKTSYQLKFPELFKSDTSIYPSYTNLKLPYPVVCRIRKNEYRAQRTLRLQGDVEHLSLRQVRAWDGVRVARMFAGGPSLGLPPGAAAQAALRRVPDPLSARQRTRLYGMFD